jgi:hypothetical protein
MWFIHGFAGHFFVKDIPHVLKVRIIAKREERIRILMARNSLSYEAAITYIQKLDEQRRKWSQQLYGIETSDPGLYDLVIHIDHITVDDAVDIICHKIGTKHFQTTPQSQQQIEDLSLAAEVKAALIDLKPDIEVMAHRGGVRVTTASSLTQQSKLEKEIRVIAEKIPEIKSLEINLTPGARFSTD